ncbi:MAG: hypothetical protein J1F28_05340 [Oscillospiraceae bacterium]|nr:hypothetical protein [Oscillospiraceae bacterium]
MKKFFTKNLKNKLITLAICAALYLALILISEFTWLGHTYLFHWTIIKMYGFSWVIAAVFIFFNGLPAALAISVGNFVGTFLGHYLGTYLDRQAYAQITPDMDEYRKMYILYETNYPFEIWFLTVLGSLLLGIILTIIFAIIARLKRKPQTENS